jgi:hypothetical protein
MPETTHHRPTLALGGTGKTGRRLVERLTRRDIPVQIGSRSAGLPFDWEQPSTWRPVFQDAEAAYTYVPDLVVERSMGPDGPVEPGEPAMSELASESCYSPCALRCFPMGRPSFSEAVR